ncbi:unnamed protein product [Paramecium pentaurelia]|uniref:Response regulatory domain-containing protein n=1 Tax=Paramecium pentaurelia TaxID=43138 RepID=A0A8S1YEU4_9CILI|nr:unnamed protein product [Paramecium pentaurelia]
MGQELQKNNCNQYKNSNSESEKKGLGLSIVAKLVQGLTESENNQLIIRSIKNEGSLVSFQVVNQQFNQNAYQLSFYLSNKNLIKEIYNSFSIIQEQNSETQQATSRLNGFELKQVILMPESPEYFFHKNISSFKNIDHQRIQEEKLICQYCTHVLVVDEKPFHQIALNTLLKNYNIKADSVFDGFQAIEKVKLKIQSLFKFIVHFYGY